MLEEAVKLVESVCARLPVRGAARLATSPSWEPPETGRPLAAHSPPTNEVPSRPAQPSHLRDQPRKHVAGRGDEVEVSFRGRSTIAAHVHVLFARLTHQDHGIGTPVISSLDRRDPW